MTPADATRFRSKFHRTRSTRDCWIWQAGLDADGYGVFSVGGRSRRAHRVSYHLAHGEPPAGRVLHACGERRCVNPRHLRVGSASENVEDMRIHGTLATGDRNGARKHPEKILRGTAVASSRLCPASVKAIRRRAQNEPYGALAREYGVSTSTISRVVNGQQWRDV